jgi:hypothetical protein
LYGEELIGIYPLTDGSSVRWGCSDIDVDDIDSARNLQTALKIKSINSFVEKTRRGYHVWVFANDWVPAAVMRRAFLSAHEAVNLVAKEVNPKQEEATGLGNYVRLPYPAGIDNIPENRYMLLDKDDSPMPLKDFLHQAYETRTNINLLSPLAEKHKPRSKMHFNNLTISPSVNTSLDKVNGYIATIWRNGPMEGNDRSNTLIRMCHYMFEYGTPINDAYTILVDADKRWGKFHLRPDAVVHLTKIIEDCYGKDHTYKEDFNP